MTLALPARAKLNLDLAVLGRRDDGLHELRTHMQSIDLHDLLEVEAAEETSLSVTGLDVPAAAGNTVLIAQKALETTVGRSLPARFTLHKRIPPGSGLGGASSDAAAALRALAAMHCLEVDLRLVASSVGADVTFFVQGGAALIEGAGERVTPTAVTPRWFVVAWPGIELSTAAVYRAWDELKGDKGDGANHLRPAAGHVDQRIDAFAARLGPGWQMTGSGSAFFLVCARREEAVAAAGTLECWTAVSQAVGAWA